MRIDDSKRGWRLWFVWLLANGLGLAIGFGVYFPLVVGLAENLVPVLQVIVSLAGGAVLGASLGIAQRHVLRQVWPQLANWVRSSTVGGAVGGLSGLLVGNMAGAMGGFGLALLVGGACLGAGVGSGQWWILRRSRSGAGWWWVANIVGLGFGPFAGRVLGEAAFNFLNVTGGDAVAKVSATVIFGGLMLLVNGAITGAVLVRLNSKDNTLASEPAHAGG